MITDNYAPTKDLGDGVTTIFTADWYPLNTDSVKVYFEDYETGVQTEQTTGFTKEILSDNTLKVTFIVAPGDPTPADSVYVILARETTDSQATAYRTSTGFPAQVLENDLDKRTAVSQEQEDKIGRSLTYPLGTDSAISQEIPAPSVANAGKTIKINTAGDGWEVTDGDPDDAQTDAAASAAAAAASETNAASSEANAAASEAAAAASAASINLPEIDSGDAGKGLKVNAGGTGYELTDIFTGFGAWVAINDDTIYQAASDGFIVGYYNSGSDGIGTVYTDSNAIPTTVRQISEVDASIQSNSIMCPVRKNDYYRVTSSGSGGANVLYFLPIN